MNTKIKNIGLALMLVFLASSCKKNWLDVTSGSQIRSEDQFKTEGGFKDALIGVYIGMTDQSLYAKDMSWNIPELMAQQYPPYPDFKFTEQFDFQNYRYTTLLAKPKIEGIWNKSYNTIANINNALGNIDKNKSVLNPISYSIIKGELLGLRAFLHFDLIRTFGYGNLANRTDISGKMAVPYVKEFNKELTEQLPYSKTFELLNQDINEALVLLREDPIFNNPKKPSSYYTNVNRDGFYNKREQRMNYYAVKGLQARVLQWQGGATDMANAAKAAEEVIKDAPARLITTSSAALASPVLYAEHLFNLNVVGFTDIINPYLNANDVNNTQAIFLTNQRAEELYETVNPNIGLVDFRYNTLLQSQAKGLLPIKLFQKNYAGKNTVPLIRLPEMYYIAAEYYATVTPSKAVDYLNLVRESRGIIQEVPSSSTVAQIQDELYKEYRKEFVMEGQLLFFYKRLGKTTFPGIPANIVANDKVYVLPYPDSEIEFGNRVQ